jgi:hypothetical protein
VVGLTRPLQRLLAARPRRGASALLLSLLLASSVNGASSALARGDAHWQRRAEGQVEGRAPSGQIQAAIAAYQTAILEEPESLEPHWKLLRALWFCGEFATEDADALHDLHERAREGSNLALAALAARVGGTDVLARAGPDQLPALIAPRERTHAAQLYFWSAINLGAWSRTAGLIRAVRAGAARRLHEATLRSIALDPDVEQGGALRLLSRLHSELPRVPLFSGWVDRSQAMPLAERALSEYPEHPGNGYLLGLTILSHAPERRLEGLRWLERTAELVPRSDHTVEDLSIRSAARKRLAVEIAP